MNKITWVPPNIWNDYRWNEMEQALFERIFENENKRLKKRMKKVSRKHDIKSFLITIRYNDVDTTLTISQGLPDEVAALAKDAGEYLKDNPFCL